MLLSVSELYIYPIKSCGSLNVAEADITDVGFKHDREWMIVRENGWFVTQRQYPHMALIQPELTSGGLVLRAPGKSDIAVPIVAGKAAACLPVRVWDDTVAAADQGDAAAKWISQFLGRACRLVRMDGERPLNPKYQVKGRTAMSFADSMPFLLTTQASLDDLNQRLEKPVSMTRFRPNIVVRGGEAFQEDHWQKIEAGAITFRLPKRCSRCEIITIDQKTAVKDVEPMETLAGYRYQTRGIMFGKNAVAEQPGVVRVGDKVRVVA